MSRLALSWEVAVCGWKGAVGVGTLGWALYGTVSTLGFGRSPTWDANLAFVAFALAGALLGVLSYRPQGGGACQTRT